MFVLLSFITRQITCLFVSMAVIESERSCTVTASSSGLHITQSVDSRLGCGTKSQPWILVAPPGQQIQVSLIDFGSKVRNAEISSPRLCQQYAYIVDKSAKMNLSVCGLSHDRKKEIYKSSLNTIEVILNSENNLHSIDERPNYLIGFIGKRITLSSSYSFSAY